MQRDEQIAEQIFADDNKVGLLAGWGSFPVEVAQRCVEQGKQVYVVAFKGHADPTTRRIRYRTSLDWAPENRGAHAVL